MSVSSGDVAFSMIAKKANRDVANYCCFGFTTNSFFQRNSQPRMRKFPMYGIRLTTTCFLKMMHVKKLHPRFLLHISQKGNLAGFAFTQTANMLALRSSSVVIVPQVQIRPSAFRWCRRLSSTTDLKEDRRDVNITFTTVESSQMKPGASMVPSILSDATSLVDSLLSYTSSLVDQKASNLIAFSGGVDSSLTAALVHRSFHSNDGKKYGGNVKAVLGVSNSLPKRQLLLAQDVASSIGIDLLEVRTTEGLDDTYIENKGQACFVCKTHLYTALEAVSQKASEMSNGSTRDVILYNGTNKDDTRDKTRLGLKAASNFSVRSPLINVTKDEVRIASKHLDLPNWNYAASPCLRSRLALGVEATEKHLRAVNMAENRIRGLLDLDDTVDMRVRMLAGKVAMVELDPKWFAGNTSAEEIVRSQGFEQYCKDLGFDGGVGIRAFKSGSVSL